MLHRRCRTQCDCANLYATRSDTVYSMSVERWALSDVSQQPALQSSRFDLMAVSWNAYRILESLANCETVDGLLAALGVASDADSFYGHKTRYIQCNCRNSIKRKIRTIWQRLLTARYNDFRYFIIAFASMMLRASWLAMEYMIWGLGKQ